MIPATTGSNVRITAARDGSTKRWPHSCSVNASALQHTPVIAAATSTCAGDVSEPADRDDRDREHREHDELAGSERDRIEVLREVRADQDPETEEERAPRA